MRKSKLVLSLILVMSMAGCATFFEASDGKRDPKIQALVESGMTFVYYIKKYEDLPTIERTKKSEAEANAFLKTEFPDLEEDFFQLVSNGVDKLGKVSGIPTSLTSVLRIYLSIKRAEMKEELV